MRAATVFAHRQLRRVRDDVANLDARGDHERRGRACARGGRGLQRQQKPQPQLQPGARSALQRAPATMDSSDAAVMGSMTKRSTSFDSTFSKQCALPCVPQSGAQQTRRLRGGSQANARANGTSDAPPRCRRPC
jgi:hypothetical protein